MLTIIIGLEEAGLSDDMWYDLTSSLIENHKKNYGFLGEKSSDMAKDSSSRFRSFLIGALCLARESYLSIPRISAKDNLVSLKDPNLRLEWIAKLKSSKPEPRDFYEKRDRETWPSDYLISLLKEHDTPILTKEALHEAEMIQNNLNQAFTLTVTRKELLAFRDTSSTLKLNPHLLNLLDNKIPNACNALVNGRLVAIDLKNSGDFRLGFGKYFLQHDATSSLKELFDYLATRIVESFPNEKFNQIQISNLLFKSLVRDSDSYHPRTKLVISINQLYGSNSSKISIYSKFTRPNHSKGDKPAVIATPSDIVRLPLTNLEDITQFRTYK